MRNEMQRTFNAAGIVWLVTACCAIAENGGAWMSGRLAEISAQRGVKYIASRDSLVSAVKDKAVRHQVSAVINDPKSDPLARLLSRRIIGRAERPGADQAFWKNIAAVAEEIRGNPEAPRSILPASDSLRGIDPRVGLGLPVPLDHPGEGLKTGKARSAAFKAAVESLLKDDMSLAVESIVWHDRGTLLTELTQSVEASAGTRPGNRDASASSRESLSLAQTAQVVAGWLLVVRADSTSVAAIREWGRRDKDKAFAIEALLWLMGQHRVGTMEIKVDVEVRMEAMAAYARIAGPKALPLLRGMQDGSEDPRIREAAKKAIATVEESPTTRRAAQDR